ncbi:MAG: uracil-DNA glycosylase [Phycisphaerales bacterium]
MELSSIRAARQCVETDRLLGLDAVLLRARPAPIVADASPTPPVATANPTVVNVRDGWTREERVASLEQLRERHDRECPHCTTATAHTKTVFGEGNPEAPLMFIGEAPGETEDQLGRPFVGKAGQKLDEMIGAMGFEREQVYIANVLKSRPPGNRTPLQHEVEACGPYLLEQIGIVNPKVIVSLGGPATKFLLGTEVGITRLRGVWGELHLGTRTIPVMPTFHPAYLLRNYTVQTRREMWSDLQSAAARVGAPPNAKR